MGKSQNWLSPQNLGLCAVGAHLSAIGFDGGTLRNKEISTIRIDEERQELIDSLSPGHLADYEDLYQIYQDEWQKRYRPR